MLSKCRKLQIFFNLPFTLNRYLSWSAIPPEKIENEDSEIGLKVKTVEFDDQKKKYVSKEQTLNSILKNKTLYFVVGYPYETADTSIYTYIYIYIYIYIEEEMNVLRLKIKNYTYGSMECNQLQAISQSTKSEQILGITPAPTIKIIQFANQRELLQTAIFIVSATSDIQKNLGCEGMLEGIIKGGNIIHSLPIIKKWGGYELIKLAVNVLAFIAIMTFNMFLFNGMSGRIIRKDDNPHFLSKQAFKY